MEVTMQPPGTLLSLLKRHGRGSRLVKLWLQSFVCGLANRLFQKPTGRSAFAADKAFGLHPRLTVG